MAIIKGDTLVAAASVSSGQYPAWRQPMVPNTFSPIPNTENMSGYKWTKTPILGPADGSGIIDGWSSLARLDNTWWAPATGGHGEWQNAVVMIDLAADQPAWQELDPGDDFFRAITNSPYYAPDDTGYRRATSTHSYYSAWGVRTGKTPDGLARIMRVTDHARYGDGGFVGPFNGPEVSSFRLTDLKWDVPGRWPDCPHKYFWGATCQDPDTDDIYYHSGDYDFIDKFTVSTGTWSLLNTTPVYPDPGRVVAWVDHASLFDKLHQRIASFHYMTGSPRLDLVDVATGAVTIITSFIGAIPPAASSGAFVHDVDNDRYLLMKGTQLHALEQVSSTTWACTLLYTFPAFPPTTAVGGDGSWFTRFTYFPDLGGCAAWPHYASPILFFPTRA